MFYLLKTTFYNNTYTLLFISYSCLHTPVEFLAIGLDPNIFAFT